MDDGELFQDRRLREFLLCEERCFEQGLARFRAVNAKLPTRGLLLLASKTLFDLAFIHENPSHTALCAEAAISRRRVARSAPVCERGEL